MATSDANSTPVEPAAPSPDDATAAVRQAMELAQAAVAEAMAAAQKSVADAVAATAAVMASDQANTDKP